MNNTALQRLSDVSLGVFLGVLLAGVVVLATGYNEALIRHLALAGLVPLLAFIGLATWIDVKDS